ncbi:hypothetical protein NDU88_002146 [Pleurodeles waltl]|uniref:Uncharacterized protein n=1 Tax=Pleurodeles waltl TaxID=8319 RepID=A0AAV7W381_PLEWA|nr:hypothetical protein NDU88_002146 [Pleurodeles waltl]
MNNNSNSSGRLRASYGVRKTRKQYLGNVGRCGPCDEIESAALQASVPEVGAEVIGSLKSHALPIKLRADGDFRYAWVQGLGLWCKAGQ